MRALEKGSGYWMGMMTGKVTGASGLASRPGTVSFSVANAATIAHELGHNLDLEHAPCKTPDPDPTYPYPDGNIGAHGYDHRTEKLVPPSKPDVMGYCEPSWISDYYFSNTVRYRRDVFEEEEDTAESRPGLLLWGYVDAEGRPSLEPVFAVDAPPTMPPRSGSVHTDRQEPVGGRSVLHLLPHGGGSAMPRA